MKKEIQSLEKVRCFTTETEKELYEIMGGFSIPVDESIKWYPIETGTPIRRPWDPGDVAYPCYGVAPRPELMVKE